MIEFIRTDHINICVAPEQLEAARKFYRDVIGLQQTDRPNHLFASAGYWFNIADIQLHIGVEPAQARSARHTAFEITNVDKARKHLEKCNVEIIEEPTIPGRKRFAFVDPFGNRVELLQMKDL